MKWYQAHEMELILRDTEILIKIRGIIRHTGINEGCAFGLMSVCNQAKQK